MIAISNKSKNQDDEILDYIYRAWRRDPRTGKILWAKHYGLRAWRIPIRRRPAA